MIGLLKKHIVDLPIRLKGNLKLISGNSLSPLRAQNKDFSATLQTLLTKVKLRLRCRLGLWKVSALILLLSPSNSVFEAQMRG